MSDILNAIAQSDEGAVQSLVWMAEDANLTLPPLPESYLGRLSEVVPMTCFATDKELVSSLGRVNLGNHLSAGRWPRTGMALKLQAAGRWVYWQYILVGRVHIIQVNLRIPLNEETGDAYLASVTEANMRLTRYLSNEATLARYLSEGPRIAEELGHLVIYENADGGPAEETHYIWTEERGLVVVDPTATIFSPKSGMPQTGEEVVIYA